MNQSFKSAMPVVLSITGAIGVVGTAIAVAKETPRYLEAKKNLGDNPTFWQKTKCVAKSYGPALAIGSATIASISASTLISRKIEASLSASLLLAKEGYRKYGDKVKELVGIEKNTKAVVNLSEEDTFESKLYDEAEKRGEQVFWNKYTGFFIATKLGVVQALLNMNMRLNSYNSYDTYAEYERGWCTIKQFIEESGSKVCNSQQYDLYKNYGWNIDYKCMRDEDAWIDVHYEEHYNKDNVSYTVIEFLCCEPIDEPEMGYEVPRAYRNR